jgi:2-oxoglutarate/2-oxoacid ferredoxin oxidoreductase subunit beta
MSFIKPAFAHPALPVNKLGYTKKDYEGVISTLCSGCGHDSISAAIAQACFEMNIEPHRVAKLSGIGCSSKTPAYFLSHSHGFNSVHGRMPSVASGAVLANRNLVYLGISGDGDTASIGMGQFVHAIRRNLDMTYIVMNNGCYGLTKGQDSATADEGSINKSGAENQFQSIDLAGLAMELGAPFVARSFSGDKDQLVPLIKAAFAHHGFALIDVVSPCVTFNNNVGSTKSYDYVREHMEAVDVPDYVPLGQEITASYEDGQMTSVEMHDGSKIFLRKLAKDWDPFDRNSAISTLNDARQKGQILTGLIYINEHTRDLHELLGTSRIPLNHLKEEDLCPGNAALQEINEQYR